jgi:syndecan 1
VPHKHDDTPSKNREAGLLSNFCRNPDGKDTIWCYTTDPDVEWDFCEPIKSDDMEGLWGDAGNQYRGKQRKTRTGYTCQAWNVQ